MSAPVGVLLPVRIETAFDPHPNGCRLRVIVIPDVPWLDRHDGTVRPSELDALDTAWAACSGDFSASAAGPAAFATLARAVGGARAAWLTRRFPPIATPNGFVADRSSAEMREVPRGTIIRSLPPSIDIWVTLANPPAAGPFHILIATLSPSANALRVELDDTAAADPGEEIFRPSWESARDAGLTADLELATFGLGPNDIAVLYAIGLGNADPIDLFGAHRDAGLLAVLTPGLPTNTVAGAPAADLGRDDVAWWSTVQMPRVEYEDRSIGNALTGRDDGLLPIYGPPRASAADPLPKEPRAVLPHDARGSLLVTALWPVLWSTSLKDIWGVDAADPEVVFRLGAWASRFLQPEGPFPPLRIGDQPYGVLPVTSLRRWDAAGDPHDIESRLAAQLIPARRLWAGLARKHGTIANADAAKVIDLLERLPVTARLMSTLHVPLELIQITMSAGFSPDDIRAWWRAEAARARDFRGVDPARAFVQYLAPMDIDLPLVEPTKPASPAAWMEHPERSLFATALLWFARKYDAWLGTYFHQETREELPRSLLFRLIVEAATIAASEVVRTANGLRGPVGPGEGRLSTRFNAGARPGDQTGTPAGDMFERLWHSLRPLADEDPRVLERSFLATMDAASHRIDPWVTAFAWRRLSSAAYRAERRQIGAYGWVDSPFNGTRGPTAAGLLLAPSAMQARTAVILRDKAVYDPKPAAGALPGTRRWDMTLDSSRVRLADRLAAEVRIGAHPGEVLGREVERIFPSRADVDVLRRHYQLHSANQGRRVCDGQQVLARTVAQLGAETGLQIRPDQAERLDALRQAIDVYGDLLVADAVFDVVSGRGETAGAAMDAAAGLDLPPVLDVIRTPRSGRTVSSALHVALPASGLPVVTDRSPVWRAEPALAALAASTFPPPAAWQWTREDRKADGSSTVLTVTAADLDLDVVDMIVLDPEQVAGLVLLHTHSPASPVQPTVRPIGTGPDAHARLRRLVTAFAGAPAVPTRLSVDGHAIDEAEDLAVRTELWARYRAVRQEADALIGQLQTAALGVIAPTDGAAELATARRWGVIPSFASEDAGPIDRRVFELESAGETLLSRLEKAPADTVNPPATLTIEQIGAAIAELVKPGGRLPVFSRVAPPALAATEPALRRPLVAEPFEAIPLPGQSGAGRNRLDGTWLDIVAAVRPAAARIESWQLHALVGAGPSMKAWTNWPGNPWRQGVPPPAGDVRSTVDALVVVYTPAASLNLTSAALVAAITIDTWTETIPSETQTVGAAFGFNAPAARPPQAILVAVPPKDDTPLDGDTLLDIVVETRELVHARMATPEDLQSLAAALPMTLVESRYADPAGLKLGDWEEQ